MNIPSKEIIDMNKSSQEIIDMNIPSKEIIDMNKSSQEIIDTDTYNPSQEIELYFKFHEMEVQSCNFNLNEELILFSKAKAFINRDDINLVGVYSIQKNKAICQKIYMIPKEAEVISVSKYDKIWLHFNNDIYEWNLLTGNTTILSKNIDEVIKYFLLYCILLNLLKFPN